jgi:hypothetical protein
MIKLTDINKDIVFEEKAHTYHLGDRELYSVTRLLSLFKEKFDPDGFIAYRCAKKEGVTKEEIKARWEKTKDDACVYGTKIHGQVEHFLKTGKVEDKEDKDIVEQFTKIKFRGKVYSEIGLHSTRYGLAGTSDIISLEKNTAIISDIKTNKRFDIKNKYSKKYLYPINHVPETHLHGYSLQILIYGEMVKEHGFDFEPGQILWVNPDTRKVEKFDVLDLNKEVQDLLTHYKQITDF